MLRTLAAIIVTALSIGGVLLGGFYCWTGVAVIVLLGPLAEHLFGETSVPGESGRWGTLAIIVAAPLFAAVLTVSLWMLSGLKQDPGDLLGIGAAVRDLSGIDPFAVRGEMGIVAYAGMFLSFTLTICLICLTRAHELVHRTTSSALTFTGTALYAYGFDGSYAVEHVYGHHADVGTAADPVTARRGEAFGAYFVRSTFGQYRNAWRREAARLESAGAAAWSLRNRVLIGHAMTGGYIVLGFAAAGLWGGLINLAMMLYVKWNSEVSNYVQHYGLVRVSGTPIAPRHSWDCRFALSSVVTVNLTRHADHHVHSYRPFWQLVPSDDAPRMPLGFILTQLAATQPPLWRKLTEPRLRHWDEALASDGERALLAKHSG